MLIAACSGPIADEVSEACQMQNQTPLSNGTDPNTL